MPAVALLLLVGQVVDSSLAVPDWSLTEEDLALIELIEQLLAAPVDIRHASPSELMEVPGISEQAAVTVVAAYRRGTPLDSLLESVGVTKTTAPMLKAGKTAKPWMTRGWVRWRSDTLISSLSYSTRSIRFEASGRELKGVLLAESDMREHEFPDWWGGGVSWRRGGMRALVGDFVAGLGQGLVLTAPHASSVLTAEGGEAGVLALPRYALESRGFRGMGLEAEIRDGRFGVLGSSKHRDARLNPDGTVARLVLSGTHADSARRAEKNRVTEQAMALVARWRWSGFTAAAALSGQQYSRWFCPVESVYSFVGRRIAQLGVAVTAQRREGRVLLEVARSSGGGNAAALEVISRPSTATASARVRTYGSRYFAPLSRRPSLSNRKSRTEADVRLKVRLFGLELGATANTYREYQEDSLPASVKVTAGYAGPGFLLKLAVGRRFRLVAEQSRTADLLFGFVLGRERLEFRLGDEYSETRGGGGLMAAMLASSRRGPLDIGLAAAHFSILGGGVRMWVSEPGSGRMRTTYSTSKSGWRMALGLGCRFGCIGRIGVKVGWELQGSVRTDAAAEVQFGGASD